MGIYGMSDLHLSLSIDKPMDIFGENWKNYMELIEENWRKTISDDDYVIIPGDISWATYLEQAYKDFMFIESLPGKKIISKGNHDYWWTTSNKLHEYLKKNNFSTISFMHNNSFNCNDFFICGTRGWKDPDDEGFNSDDKKIYMRELERLKLSLDSIQNNKSKKIIVALHYPPYNFKKKSSKFIEIMKNYNVTICVYGHLHSFANYNISNEEIDGIEFKLISSDYLNFIPLKLV